jgi:predicted lipoprotein with Yx(FWY)xxD motif
MRKMLPVATLVSAVAALAVAAVAYATVATRTDARATDVKISTRNLPKLGAVLVDSTGRTLYMFVPDKRSKVTCVGSCAAVWPPVKLPAGAKAVAGGEVKQSLLGSDPNPAGGRVVTYNKWPLYTYVTDTGAGQAKGQGLKLNGGLWYVLAPSGKVIRTSAGGYP